MAIINVVEKGIADQIRGNIGKIGDPDPENILGIYQIKTISGKQYVSKMSFYAPTNPQTQAQQNWRAVFTAAVTAWQALTPTQKDVYNQRAKYKPLSGYNLYLREYLLSN